MHAFGILGRASAPFCDPSSTKNETAKLKSGIAHAKRSSEAVAVYGGNEILPQNDKVPPTSIPRNFANDFTMDPEIARRQNLTEQLGLPQSSVSDYTSLSRAAAAAPAIKQINTSQPRPVNT